MKRILLPLIKYLSIVLITSAIGLELWHLQLVVTQSQQPVLPPAVSWVARFALIAHGFEAIIAAVCAARQQRRAFFYAIYTFFVGTVGLVELYRSKTEIVK